MVSCKCDGVLPDDSGSAIAFIDFYDRCFVCCIHLVCFSKGCGKYIF